MPTYEVALDDGRKIHIDADDQDAALAGAQHFLNNSPQKVPPLPSGYQLEDGAPWNAFRVSDSPGAVQINAANIKQARDQGYSDEAIANHLASVYPKLMLDHLSGTTPQKNPFDQFDGPASANEGPWTKYQQQQKAATSEGPWTAYQKAAPGKPLQFDDLPPNQAGNLRFDDLPPNTPNEPVTFSGARNAFNSGVVKGVYNIPGDVMALANLGRRGYAALTGGNYDPVKDDWSLGQTYEKGRDYVDKIYTPKNKTEEWLKWGSDFLPAMVTGPEGLAADSGLGIAKVLAKRAATQVAAPAIAAKVADTAAQGTPLEPYAGPAAALLAGGVGIKGRAPEVSVDAAKAETNASYDAARTAGVMYDQNALASRAAAAKADLTKRGISEQSAPSAHDTLDSFINNTAPMSLTSLEEQRQLFNKDASKGGKEGLAANAVKGVIDEVMSDPRNASSWAGANPAEAYATLQKARGQALATQRLRDIEALQNDAQVGTNVHGTEPSKALRMQFGSALKSDDFMARFNNPDVVSQMQSISKGAFPQGVAKRLGGGDLSKWRALELAGLAFPATMPFIVGARALGYGLSKVADRRVQAKVDALKQTVAKQGGVPFTPAGNPWMTRAFVGALGANGGRRQ